MKKFNRNQRITGITKTLIENPNKIINLNRFTEMFGAAKSTISEDIVVIRETLNNLSMGNIETIAGAAGGIKYTYGISEEKINEFTEKLCMILQEKQRIVPGEDRKSTRLNSSHANISYAVFCLKKKNHI